MFQEIDGNKSLASKLCNIGMRALNHRECGALEAADTLLGIPLYRTDNNTSIRWLDIGLNRSKRIKNRGAIECLNAQDTDIFYKSWVDDYYPNRPDDLENLNLYYFSKWYEKVYSKPKEGSERHYPLGHGHYLKKRSKPILINHDKYSPAQKPEEFYHSLLLMFKPWRSHNDILCSKSTYLEAFQSCKAELKDAVEYASVQQSLRENIDRVYEAVEERVASIQRVTENGRGDNDNGPDHPDVFHPDQVIDPLDDVQQLNVLPAEPSDLHSMINKLNSDQLRVFKNVTDAMGNGKIVRQFVSDTGGTGKSFLIATIKAWVTQKLGKDVAVCAPTGVAAFNVNGLTTYRLLQLPVEHGKTPKYTYLSDISLQTFRAVL